MNNFLPKQNILGIEVTNASESENLEYIINSVVNFTKKYYITTPNPEMVVLAHREKRFKTVVNNAGLALSDGTGLILASRILGKPLKSRVTGIDCMVSLCREVSKRPITVGFLGGKEGIAEKASECLLKKYPGLRVTFIGREIPANGKWQMANSANLDSNDSPSAIRSKPLADILFVAFGFPKQEYFMAQNLEKLPVKVMMGVGGAFDYISGTVPRAPKWVRSIGCEWLFRLLVQPWRIKRQLALISFIKLVLKAKFQKTS